MKMLLLSLISFVLLSATPPAASPQATGSLTLTFEDLRADQGTVEVALFNSKKSFLKKGMAIDKKRVPVQNGQVVVTFDNLPFGVYAVTSYHDVNDNNKFDRNFVGIPKEPVAVSRMYKKKMRKPRFNEAHFRLEAPSHEERMKFVKY